MTATVVSRKINKFGRDLQCHVILNLVVLTVIVQSFVNCSTFTSAIRLLVGIEFNLYYFFFTKFNKMYLGLI